MKRRLKYGIIVFLFLFALFWAMMWLLGTPGGARWLLGMISQWSSIKINAVEVKGRILDELYLEKVEIQWPQGKINIGTSLIRWHPASLLTGKVTFHDLHLNRVHIQQYDQLESKTPPNLTLPRISGLMTWLNIEVRSLQLNQLTYYRFNKPPITVEHISTHAAWHQGVLRIRHFSFETSQGHGEGKGELVFLEPSVTLDFSISLKQIIMGLDHLSLKARLIPGLHPEQMKGQILIIGKSESVEHLRFKTEVGITSNRIRLRNLLFSQSGRHGTISGEGEINISGNEPLAQIHLGLKGLDLSKELKTKTNLSGNLDIKGTPSSYRGWFRLENIGSSWHAANLSGTLQGNLKGIKISIGEGTLLDGTMSGQFEATWSEGISMVGILQGRDLNPNEITPDWYGKINLDMEGKIQWFQTSPIKGRVDIHLLKSHLRGQALIGWIKARIDNGILYLDKGDLRGKGFDIFAQGILQERIKFNASISDLSGLVPKSRGLFFGKGWVRWRENQLSGSFAGKGQDLSLGNTSVDDLHISAKLDEGEKGVVDLKAEAHQLVFRSIQSDFMTLNVVGTVSHHHINIETQCPKGEVKGTFVGSYIKKGWKGNVIRFSGEFPSGRTWSLHEPAELSIAKKKFKLGPFMILSKTGEKINIHADLFLDPIYGFIEMEWQKVDLAHANLWLKKSYLIGETTGKLKTQWLGENRLWLTAEVKTAGSFHDPNVRLELSKGLVNIDWDEKGLQSHYELVLAEGGDIHGQFSSSQPAHFALPEEGRIEVNWRDIDLTILKTWLPPKLSIEGQSTGYLSGEWLKGKRFDMVGGTDISKGWMKWETVDDVVSSRLQNVDLSWSWRDDVLNSHISIDLPEYGEITGNLQLPLSTSLPLSIRDTGPVHLSIQGEVHEKGLLPILFPEFVLESQGQIDLNLNINGTWGRPRVEVDLQMKKAGVELNTTIAKDQKTIEPLKLKLPRTWAKLNWDEGGLFASWEIGLDDGKTYGSITSSQPARLRFPKEGKFKLGWRGIELNLLRPLLQPTLTLEGSFSGDFDGQWLSGSRLNLRGKMGIFQSRLALKTKKGLISANIKTADLNLDWREEIFSGEIDVALEKYGHLGGNFKLPITTQLPISIQKNHPIHFSLMGEVQESGLFSSLFPDLIYESQGQLNLNLNVNGTWEKPHWQGFLKLEKAKAYLPPAGIHLEDLGVEAKFTEDRIQVISFRTRSGPGHIEGTGTFWLKNWRISRYQWNLIGERFQTVYLPEFQVLSSPHLNFEGTMEKLTVRGEIKIPELSLLGRQTKEIIRPSPDVIIVDARGTSKPSMAFPLDVEVRIVLGDKIQVKAEGVDARLTGEVMIRVQNSKEIMAQGEIQVAQGQYSYYGQKLEINRGRLIFNGPIDNPTLDILALRKIKRETRWKEQMNEVQAGVVITGNIRFPLIRLYSRPTMSDTDILSYIVLGQPMGKGISKDQNNLLMKAAGALLSAGESVLLQKKLSSHLGIDTLDIETDSGDLSRSLVTIGKYLNPRLYVGLGKSLFTNTYQIILRYSLTKNFEVESKTGTVSGANLYFKIEFD